MKFASLCVRTNNLLVICLVYMMAFSWMQLSAASKEDLSSHQFAVNFFNKQAKLKPIPPTDKEYSCELTPKQDVKKGLWGYVDTRDKWIIKPVFDEIREFEKDNCAIVKFKGFWGVIDRSQSFCIVPICAEIKRSVKEGLFIVSCADVLLNEYDTKSYTKKRDTELLPSVSGSNKHYIFIQHDGTYLTADKYEKIVDFDSSQRAIVSTNKGCGLLKDDGTYVYEPRFTEMSQYATGLYKVKEKDGYGVVSHDGHFVLATSYEIIDPWTQNEPIWVKRSNNHLWGAVDSRGEIIVPTQLDAKPSFSASSIQIVTSNGKYGILRKDGKFLSKCKDEYIEYVGNRYWTMRKAGHFGYYKINGDATNYVELPRIAEAGDGKNAFPKYRNKYSSGAESRVWLSGMSQAAFYSALLDEKQSSFVFESHSQDYELSIQWEDTVCLRLKNLETKKSYKLNFERPIGLFSLDSNGNRREMYSNEYVFGTYDFDKDGTEELVIAMRDNSSSGWEKPSGGCYSILKIKSNGECSWIKSRKFSDAPVGSATFSNGTINAKSIDVSYSSGLPRVENFGLIGPVMTTGDLSFNYEGYLTKIGGYHIIYDSNNKPRLAEDYGDGYVTRNYKLARFDQRVIEVSFEIDCMGDGNFDGTASEIWTFNNQGLLESYNPFACNGGSQMYYVYDNNRNLRYEIESRTVGSITEYKEESANIDVFGNWTEKQAIVYDEERRPSESYQYRTIEYYTESDNGK